MLQVNLIEILLLHPNQERTFWIDRIVPLYQILGDQKTKLASRGVK